MKIESGLSKEAFAVIIYDKILTAVKAYEAIDKIFYEKDDCYVDPFVYSQAVKYISHIAFMKWGCLHDDKLMEDITQNVNIDYLYDHYLNNEHFADNFMVIFEKKHLPIWMVDCKHDYMAYWAR